MKRSLLLPCAAGGLAGCLNAALCLIGFSFDPKNFSWHILPAGFIHGATLAAFPLLSYSAVRDRKMPLGRTLLLAILLGYFAGWGSWLPLSLSLESSPAAETFQKWLQFPVREKPHVMFQMFGLVSALTFLTLAVGQSATRSKAYITLLFVGSGVLGSLWFWAEIAHRWPQALLHGSIWGVLVGIAYLKSKPD